MRLISFKPLRKNSLFGFATVELAGGLTVRDCPVCGGGGKFWAAFPGAPQIDRDGRQIEVDGKKQFSVILSWASRETRARWSEAVVALVREQHPGVLE